MKSRNWSILTVLMVVLVITACNSNSIDDTTDDLVATLGAEATGMQPTIDALAATRSILLTQDAIPTATVTPVAPLITGNDGLETTLIWNITTTGLGAGGGQHELHTTSEAHHFLFQGQANTEVTVYVTPASPDSLPQFTILDPAGNVLAQAVAQGPAQPAQATITLASDGIYHIRVSAAAPGRYGLGMDVGN